MSASPARARGADRAPAGTLAAAEWAQIGRAAPALAVTMRRYLAQAATFLAPRSVDAADGALRQLARWLLASTEHRIGRRDPPRRHRGLQGVAV